jgi:hypothetical protein
VFSFSIPHHLQLHFLPSHIGQIMPTTNTITDLALSLLRGFYKSWLNSILFVLSDSIIRITKNFALLLGPMNPNPTTTRDKLIAELQIRYRTFYVEYDINQVSYNFPHIYSCCCFTEKSIYDILIYMFCLYSW